MPGNSFFRVLAWKRSGTATSSVSSDERTLVGGQLHLHLAGRAARRGT